LKHNWYLAPKSVKKLTALTEDNCCLGATDEESI
jgi:hypothetical protein